MNMPTVKEILDAHEAKMHKRVEILKGDLAAIRTSRATPSLLEKIEVDYYGAPTPIPQVASVTVPEPRMLMIKPWDKSMMKAIEKAILTSDLGLNPNNDGVVIRLSLPQLTEERRKELVKTVGKRVEEARVSIRNLRREVNEAIKKGEKARQITEDDAECGVEDAQKLTDKIMKDIDNVQARKEKEVMEV